MEQEVATLSLDPKLHKQARDLNEKVLAAIDAEVVTEDISGEQVVNIAARVTRIPRDNILRQIAFLIDQGSPKEMETVAYGVQQAIAEHVARMSLVN